MTVPNSESTPQFSAVDFFCSGGGMTVGFRNAGVKVLGGIDIDPGCEATYTGNNPDSKFILADIKKLTFKKLNVELNIEKKDDKLIFICCSPCQYWSRMYTDRTKSGGSKNLLTDFERFVRHFRPGHIVLENVPGILRRRGNPLNGFLEFLEANDYKFVYRIINTSHYGVPQSRRRFVLIASRVKSNITFPEADTKKAPPTVRQTIGDPSIFPPIPEGRRDETAFLHTTSGLSERNKQRLALTEHNGGTRKAWSKTHLQIPAYVGKDDSFDDVYGRMFWDKPAPTLTTKFHSITNGRFAHPDQDRGISLREGAVLQTFDITYKFVSNSIAGTARLIGNAVPPALSQRIAEAIIKSN